MQFFWLGVPKINSDFILNQTPCISQCIFYASIEFWCKFINNTCSLQKIEFVKNGICSGCKSFQRYIEEKCFLTMRSSIIFFLRITTTTLHS